MNRPLRSLALPLTLATRPLLAWFDARVVRLVSWTIEVRLVPPILEAIRASDARLDRIEALIEKTDRSASRMAEEVDLVLDGLTREVFRLQARLEQIRGDVRPTVGGLTLLAEADEGPDEHSRAG